MSTDAQLLDAYARAFRKTTGKAPYLGPPINARALRGLRRAIELGGDPSTTEVFRDERGELKTRMRLKEV